MTQWISRLAERVGIVPEYHDLRGQVRVTSDETRQAILGAMGLAVASDRDARAALREVDARKRGRMLDPVRVRPRGARSATAIDLRLPEAARTETAWSATLTLESGEALAREGLAAVGAGGGARIDLGTMPPYGYHRLEVRATVGGRERGAEQSLIVVPRACRRQRPVFGVTANLYSVRSGADWGVGDLSTLAALLEWTAEEGGDFVGVNPLHAIRNRGWDVSPYSPVSRLYRNPIYLDPAAVADAGAEARLLLRSPEVLAERESLRAGGKVEYERVMALKRRVLEALHAGATPGEDYRRFIEAEGIPLERFATFEALADRLGQADWQQWPEPYRDPRSSKVTAFRDERAADVDFHRWLQFELDRQLGAAAARGRRAGLRIGVYHDLAIGTSASGADIWANPHLFLRGVTIGAPPDDYSPAGQNWGLPPIDPRALREDRYDFWVRLLRASFRHGGALRIDHVMGLFRQLWIPEGASGADGAYVRFPADDLLGILVLEARRHGAVVIGEDLGTVPPEVPPALRRRGILSSRVFYFQREGTRFRPAAEYEAAALATANTHDLPPMAGFWSGRDIELRRAVGDIDSDEAADRARREREEARRAMLQRLAADGVLPAAAEPATGEELRGAVHAFLCKTPAAMIGLNLDDLVGETDPVNLPGVSPDRYASWTRRLVKPVESLAADPQARAALRCGRE